MKADGLGDEVGLEFFQRITANSRCHNPICIPLADDGEAEDLVEKFLQLGGGSPVDVDSDAVSNN